MHLKEHIKYCKCGDEIEIERYNLGYRTCLHCGELLAKREIARKKECVAPAYNKGAYQYIYSIDMAKDVGK